MKKQCFFFLLFRKYEQFLSKQAASSSKKEINFDEYRNKICDPNFVDEIEIEYNVNQSTLKSIETMETISNNWSENAINDFKKQTEDFGDLLWQPMNER